MILTLIGISSAVYISGGWVLNSFNPKKEYRKFLFVFCMIAMIAGLTGLLLVGVLNFYKKAEIVCSVELQSCDLNFNTLYAKTAEFNYVDNKTEHTYRGPADIVFVENGSTPTALFIVKTGGNILFDLTGQYSSTGYNIHS